MEMEHKPATSGERSGAIIPAVITFLGFLDTTLLLPIMALYAAELGAGTAVAGIIIGLYSLTNTPANIIFGRLIDKVGFKKPLAVGLIGDAVSMLLYTTIRTPLLLALTRSLHGITGGLIGPATMYSFSKRSTTRRGRAMALYGISMASATLVGFAASGIISSRYGYDAIFYTGAALLIPAIFLSLFLKEQIEPTAKPAEPFGTALVKIRSLLVNSRLTLSYASIFAQYFTFGGIVTLLPLYVTKIGLTAFHVGMLLTAFTSVFILLQIPSGVISDKVGRLPPIVTGLTLSAISLAFLPFQNSFTSLLIAMAGYGAGYGLLFPSISAMVAENTETNERGLAMGLFHALLTAGVALGAPIMGWAAQLAGVPSGMIAIPFIIILPLTLAFSYNKSNSRH